MIIEILKYNNKFLCMSLIVCIIVINYSDHDEALSSSIRCSLLASGYDKQRGP